MPLSGLWLCPAWVRGTNSRTRATLRRAIRISAISLGVANTRGPHTHGAHGRRMAGNLCWFPVFRGQFWPAGALSSALFPHWRISPHSAGVPNTRAYACISPHSGRITLLSVGETGRKTHLHSQALWLSVRGVPSSQRRMRIRTWRRRRQRLIFDLRRCAHARGRTPVDKPVRKRTFIGPSVRLCSRAALSLEQ